MSGCLVRVSFLKSCLLVKCKRSLSLLWPIRIASSDPNDVQYCISMAKCNFFRGIRNKCPSRISLVISLTEKVKSHLLADLTAKDRAREYHFYVDDRLKM